MTYPSICTPVSGPFFCTIKLPTQQWSWLLKIMAIIDSMVSTRLSHLKPPVTRKTDPVVIFHRTELCRLRFSTAFIYPPTTKSNNVHTASVLHTHAHIPLGRTPGYSISRHVVHSPRPLRGVLSRKDDPLLAAHCIRGVVTLEECHVGFFCFFGQIPCQINHYG